MAKVHGHLFSDIYNRLLSLIVESNSTDEISNLCLDYLNRAQDELRFEALWTELLIIYTLSFTDKVASLPDDCGEICSVYHPDSNGKPEMFYYNKSSYSSDGYREINAGDKDSGFTKTLQFYVDPIGDIYLNYYKILDDFENSGTEYSWFPDSLLLRKARMLYLEDEGLISTAEYQQVEKGFDRALVNFKRGHQHVNYDIRMVQRDNLGHAITFSAYNLSDGEDDKLYDEAYGNSADIKSYYAL